ncbi:uncharacterized protein RSE6_02830 [Rhynchosporium secalis]|uniref:BTB domain-containing protein n=1 Tax=Rhynchosporium secalis TaxID=38038 RepID=A0A1E1M1D1_RHYSE|nr:uncharacterized protein RSE6_02830 [Rhynchosporium secalis]
MTSMTSVSADVAKSHQTSKYHQARKRRKTILPTYSDPKSLVTFLIGAGPNPVQFLIHKEIVCHNSRVLAVAFNGNFIKGRTQTYQIDDTTERAFKLFMQWLYSKSFTLVQDRVKYEMSESQKAAAKSENHSLVRLLHYFYPFNNDKATFSNTHASSSYAQAKILQLGRVVGLS